jgi:hypothetical protein
MPLPVFPKQSFFVTLQRALSDIPSVPLTPAEQSLTAAPPKTKIPLKVF